MLIPTLNVAINDPVMYRLFCPCLPLQTFQFRQRNFIETFGALGPFVNISHSLKSKDVVLTVQTEQNTKKLACQHFSTC